MYYENKNKTLISCIFKILILVIGSIGECLFFAGGALEKFSQFTYYVHQTNILSLLVVFVLLCLNIRDLKRIVNKEVVHLQKKFFSIIHYFVSTMVATPFFFSCFLVFSGEAKQEIDFSFGNIMTHFIFPVLVVIDWFVFGRIYIKKIRGINLYATIIPVVYTIYIIIAGRITSLPSFKGQLPFLDYEKNGWFRVSLADKQIGVFYYFVIMFVLMMLINYLLLKINIYFNKKENIQRLI